jgi:hypothetical protein
MMMLPDMMSFIFSGNSNDDSDTAPVYGPVEEPTRSLALRDLVTKTPWWQKGPFDSILRWMINLLSWVFLTSEFNFDFLSQDSREDIMPVVDPQAVILRVKDRNVEEEKANSLEEEIMRMEKYRREIIRREGGQKYKERMDKLIRRKQRRYWKRD